MNDRDDYMLNGEDEELEALLDDLEIREGRAGQGQTPRPRDHRLQASPGRGPRKEGRRGAADEGEVMTQDEVMRARRRARRGGIIPNLTPEVIQQRDWVATAIAHAEGEPAGAEKTLARRRLRALQRRKDRDRVT